MSTSGRRKECRLQEFKSGGGKIRELNPQDDTEILLVAQRMRQTLIEVLGEVRGSSMYSLEWLIQRVQWHLSLENSIAKVFLSENVDGRITGHAIARIDSDHEEKCYGYFSTIFVEAEYRRHGIATSLMASVENWFRERGIQKIVYNTAGTNSKLIRLFVADGYVISLRHGEMVQLTKVL